MPDLFGTVVPKAQPINDARFHALIVAGLARVAAKIGRGTLADRMGRSTRALDKVFNGSVPDAKALFDALLVDPSALDETFAAYGFQLVPTDVDPSDEAALLADGADLHAKHMRLVAKGTPTPRDEANLADAARPVVRGYAAIVARQNRRAA